MLDSVRQFLNVLADRAPTSAEGRRTTGIRFYESGTGHEFIATGVGVEDGILAVNLRKTHNLTPDYYVPQDTGADATRDNEYRGPSFADAS